MKVFRQDIKITATAYIVAATPEEAKELINNHCIEVDEILLEESTGGFVRSAPFKTLLEEIEVDETLPRVTISPAITLKGSFDGEYPEEVD